MPDPSSLRGGHDYQDLIAMRAIIELLRDPTRIVSVELEADDAGSIDDVRIKYRESRELRMQVKFAVDDTDAWTWAALLAVKNRPGKSTNRKARKRGQPKPVQALSTGREARPLLHKWFDSLCVLPPGIDVAGEIVTKRGVSDEVAQA